MCVGSGVLSNFLRSLDAIELPVIIESLAMNKPDSPPIHPYWLSQTKRLFPHPLFAGCISLASLTIAILFAGVAINVPGVWPMAFPSVLFFAGFIATAIAAVTPSTQSSSSAAHDAQTDKPTIAIFILLIGVYSWILTLAIHIFDAFFKNGPGSTKYFVTLGIAIAATLFTKIYGRKIVRAHFGSRGGRNLQITGWQAVYVTIFVLSLGIYFTWLVI